MAHFYILANTNYSMVCVCANLPSLQASAENFIPGLVVLDAKSEQLEG